MINNQFIGVFDSGVGGLSVVKHILKELPFEKLHYFADSANAPYGSKSAVEILQFSRAIANRFVEEGAKAIVVACNTATGIAINQLRQNLPIPLIGMEPAIKPAAARSKSGKIGVLATAKTFEADHFNTTMNRHASDVEVMMAIGHGLVELVEEGLGDSPEALALLRPMLAPMLDAGIDQLVLGCTHYPFLIPSLQKLLPASVTIVDPAPAVAQQLKRVLEGQGLLNDNRMASSLIYSSSGDPFTLQRLAETLI